MCFLEIIARICIICSYVDVWISYLGVVALCCCTVTAPYTVISSTAGAVDCVSGNGVGLAS